MKNKFALLRCSICLLLIVCSSCTIHAGQNLTFSLTNEYEKYEINHTNHGVSGNLYLQRINDEIFLLNGNNRTSLGKIELSNTGDYLILGNDVIAVDMRFTGELDFFIKKGAGVSNIYYLLVNNKGEFIARNIFSPQSINKLLELAQPDDDEDLIFSHPMLYPGTTIFECHAKIEGPAPTIQRYLYDNGKYHIIDEYKPIFLSVLEFPLEKHTTYKDELVDEINIFELQNHEIVTFKACNDVQIRMQIIDKTPFDTIMEGEVIKIIDSQRDNKGNMWIKIVSLNTNKRGWVCDDERLLSLSLE